MVEILDILGSIAKILGLPVAIFIFWWNFMIARRNEEFEIHDKLSNAYTDFLKQLIVNSDLRLLADAQNADFNAEQLMRRKALFEILLSIFERAYLLLKRPRMSEQRKRLWYSWEDFIRQWCRRRDFNALLPVLLTGEDPEFAAYIQCIAHEEVKTTTP